MSAPRLGIIVSHPIQYQAPLYRRIVDRARVAPEIVFLSRHGVGGSYDPGFGRVVSYDVPLLDGYPHLFLSNRSPVGSIEHPLGLCNPALVTVPRRQSYDVILVHGWGHLSHWLAYAGALGSRIPYMVRGEARLDTSRIPEGARQWCRRTILRQLLKRSAACLAIGSGNQHFYEAYGVDRSRIHRSPYAVDNDRFRIRGDAGRARRSELLGGLGLDPSLPTIVFVGKLQPWKRPLDLVLAFRNMTYYANLVVVGDGPLLSRLQRQAQDLSRVRLLGFVNQNDVPLWYGAADIMVMPSEHEPWGLAVNEAMAAGAVPVLSAAVGAARDLVTPSSGRTFAVGDIDQLVGTLDELVSDPSLLGTLREGGQVVLGQFTLDHAAAGIENAALQACGVVPP
jgi:glycosyltransferase involved in cell wall biosynthesis